MNAKVLYLSYDGLTDPLGQSQVLPYLCGLAGLGYEITVISLEKPERLQDEKADIEAQCGSHKISWVPILYRRTPAILSTLINLYELETTANRLWNQYRFGIVHCRSYLTALAGLRMKRRHKTKFLFDMRGFWPDERVEGGLWNLKNPIYRSIYHYFKTKEKEFITGADHIVSLTDSARREILSWNLASAPITVIPTCVDLDLFDPNKVEEADKLKLKTELGIEKDDFVLLYLGSWGTWYLTQEMLDFFSILKKKKRSTKFLLITSDKVELGNHEHRSDFIIRRVPRNAVPLFISIADLAIFFIKPTYSKMASSATKLGEIMAMNIPVITNPGWGDIEEIVNMAGGQLYKIGETEFNPDDVEKVNVYTRKYCSEKLGLDRGIDLYGKIYASLQ